MSMTVEQIAAEAMSLPRDARVLLAYLMVDSLDPAEDCSIRPVCATEAMRRLEEVRSGRIQTIPGDQALEEVRRAVAR